VPELRAKFPNLRLNEAGASLAGEELIAHLQGAERAIIALEKIDAAILSQLPDLKIIGKYGVGLDNIDMAAMRAHGVKLGWTGGVNCLGVAELALELMLGGLRKTWESRALAESGGWRQIRGRQLSGKTVGLIGFGHVGQALAGLLAPFGVRLLVNDIRDLSAAIAAAGAHAASKEQIFSEADVISLHTPKTALTTNMINAQALAMMKRDAVLVNTARGGLVDEDALHAALTDNRIGATAMDVFASEPPGDNPLIGLPNFAATTHIGGSSEESVLAMGRAAIAGLDNPREAREENFF
jgi:D-3-phosphoglycerate dehydrogenase